MENNKTPSIRFKGFTDPWEQRKLGDTVQITMGQSPDGSTYSDVPSDYILVQGNADLYNGWVFPRVWTSQMTKKADVGDLIMSVRAPAGAMGKTAYNAVIGRGVAAIKGNEFIYQLLVKMDSDGYWKALSCGSTFESLNSDNIKNADVLIPDVAEQEKIGEYFANLDHLITLHQRKYDSMLEYKKGLLQKMFPKAGEAVPEIRFPGFDGAWNEKRLGELGNTYTGLSGKTKDDFGHGDAQYITYMNIFSNPIIKSNGVDSIEIDPKQNKVKKGDIFFTTSSETPEEVGMSSVLTEDYENTYLNSFCFGFRPTFEINSYFIAFLLRSPVLRRKIEYLAQGSTRYNISKNKMLELSLLIPSLEEQLKIGSFFKSLDDQIELQRQKVELIREYKKGLLQQMLV